MVFVELWGGGGAGCGPQVVNGIVANYGGEAGTVIHGQLLVTPGADISVTIGTGGVGSAVQTVGANGSATVFGIYKAPGGSGGGRISTNGATLVHEITGEGKGRDSLRSTGGAGVFPGVGEHIFGGDAGYGSGGAAASGVGVSGGNGGLGAGGGAANDGVASSGGSGGNGIAIIYWERK